MTRLVSGRILKTPSANVSAERYQFIEISEVEPDLGVPPANNYIFTSDPEGNREWVDARTHFADENVAFGNVYAADTLFGNNLIVRNIDILDALIGETTLANIILAKQVFAANVISDRVTSNIWEGIYTANVIETDTNLYYTNDRVQSHITTKVSIGDLVDVSNIYTYNSNVGEGLIGILEGQALVWDGNIFIPVFVNSEVANVADIAGRVLTIENFTTANVAEASSNLYFTNTRVLEALVESNVIVNDLFVSGDLVVQGNSAILNVATLVVEDKNIVLANGATSAAIADGAGITIEGADANITYREAGDKIEINKNLEIQGNVIVDTGSSITGANVIDTESLTTDLVSTNLLLTDLITSNTIVNSDSITSETFFGNVVANTITTVSMTAETVFANVISNTISTVDLIANIVTTESVVSNTITSDILTITNSASFANVTVELQLVGNLTGTSDFVATLSNFTTDDLSEGSNLYYTNDRVLSHLTVSNVAVQDLLVQGDLTVQGNTVTLNVSELVVEDKNILLANGAVNATAADGAGITVQGANAEILYVSSLDSWVFNKDIRTNLVGNVTGFVSSISNHDTDDLAEANNLYYTNARVLANVSEMSVNVLSDVDISGILQGQILAWDGDKFVPGSADIALFSERSNTAALANVAILANIANLVLSLENFTTDDLNESNVNLYFSNTRARQAFTAGRGIIIQENGLIKSTDDSDLYNLAINGSVPYIVTDRMETAVTFPTVPAEDRFILRSIHVTNISETDAFISGNILYASGNTAFIADMMPLPLGGTLEFLKKTQVMQPGDKINFQSFDNTGTPANNIVSSIFTYETLAGEQDFFGTGLELNAGNVNTLVYAADQSYTILESIKLVNLEDYVIRAKVFWADANDTPRAYFSYNLPLPPNSSVELLQAPKRIEFTDKIYVNYIANSELSVFVSGRIGSLFTLDSFTGNVEPGSNVEASFSTTEDEGTVLYYSIE